MYSGALIRWRAFTKDVAVNVAWAVALQLVLTIVFFMFWRENTSAPTNDGGSLYVSLPVIGQPLFAVLAAWLAYTDNTWIRHRPCLWTQTIARAGLAIVAALWLWLWVIWIFCCLQGNDFGIGVNAMGVSATLLWQIGGGIGVTLVEAAVLAVPGCIIPVVAGHICGRAGSDALGIHKIGMRIIFFCIYTALMLATWLAGSISFSGVFLDNAPILLLVLWLTGAALGCATPLIMLSIRPNLTVIQRGLLLVAAVFGFWVGLGVLFHLGIYWTSMKWAPMGI